MKRPIPGFSLTEVMVVVAILSVLSGLVIDAGIRDSRREQVNAVVVELAGWLESVRRAALKGSSCQVTLTTTNGTLGAGAVIPKEQMWAQPMPTQMPPPRQSPTTAAAASPWSFPASAQASASR